MRNSILLIALLGFADLAAAREEPAPIGDAVRNNLAVSVLPTLPYGPRDGTNWGEPQRIGAALKRYVQGKVIIPEKLTK